MTRMLVERSFWLDCIYILDFYNFNFFFVVYEICEERVLLFKRGCATMHLRIIFVYKNFKKLKIIKKLIKPSQ